LGISKQKIKDDIFQKTGDAIEYTIQAKPEEPDFDFSKTFLVGNLEQKNKIIN